MIHPVFELDLMDYARNDDQEIPWNENSLRLFCLSTRLNDEGLGLLFLGLLRPPPRRETEFLEDSGVN